MINQPAEAGRLSLHAMGALVGIVNGESDYQDHGGNLVPDPGRRDGQRAVPGAVLHPLPPTMVYSGCAPQYFPDARSHPDEATASKADMDRWSEEQAGWRPPSGFDPWTPLAELEARLARIGTSHDRPLDRFGTALRFLECGGASRTSEDKMPSGLSSEQQRRWTESDRRLWASDFVFSFETACGLAGVTESRMRKDYPDVRHGVSVMKKARSGWGQKCNDRTWHPPFLDSCSGHKGGKRDDESDKHDYETEFDAYMDAHKGADDCEPSEDESSLSRDLWNREAASMSRVQPEDTLTAEFELEAVRDEKRRRHYWGVRLATQPMVDDEVVWWFWEPEPGDHGRAYHWVESEQEYNRQNQHWIESRQARRRRGEPEGEQAGLRELIRIIVSEGKNTGGVWFNLDLPRAVERKNDFCDWVVCCCQWGTVNASENESILTSIVEGGKLRCMTHRILLRRNERPR